jgi:hypothetical protein
MAQELEDELHELGIVVFNKFSKKENYKMIKAECSSEEIMNSLINRGILVNYCRFKVEKYLSPIKPVQCFKCQKYGHYSSACEHNVSICVKCSGNHKLTEYKNTVIKCANCKLEHTSNYGGCKVYQQNLKEKIEKIKKKIEKSSINKQYSQVVSQPNNNNMQTLISSINELTNKINDLEINFVKKVEEIVINKIHSVIESEIKNAIELKFDQIFNDKIQSIHRQHNENIIDIKSRFIYIQIDMIKFWYPTTRPEDSQIKYFIDSISRHYNLKLDWNKIKPYVDQIYNV